MCLLFPDGLELTADGVNLMDWKNPVKRAEYNSAQFYVKVDPQLQDQLYQDAHTLIRETAKQGFF